MIDTSNECLINQKRKTSMITFESISEKQEESSNSSVKNTKLAKSKSIQINNKSKLTSNNDILKDAINISINNIQKKKRVTLKHIKKRSFQETNNENSFSLFKRRNTKEKSTNIFNKRTSFQQDNNRSFSFYNQIKKSLRLSNSQLGPISIFYSNKNSVVEQNFVKKKNVNLANSESFLDMKYFADKKYKHSILQKGKLNLQDHKNLHSFSLFKRLKESYLYEKSEATLFKIKICYGFLGIFSLLSILLEIADVFLFNRKSKEYLKENYNIYLKEDFNIENYYFIQNRKISNQENTIRIFNLIFSIISFFMHLIIHFIKNRFEKDSDDRNRYNNNYYGYKRRKKILRNHNTNSYNNPNDNHIKFIFSDNLVTKDFVSKEALIKLIKNCVISVVFYPPGINKVFIGINDKVIYVYSLNIFFLLITFFKLKNIYYAIYYLSPYNNLLYKTICSSNMAQLNIKFMLRFLLNNFPMSFIIINFIIICLVSCILLYTIEIFSINIQNGIWNNKGENDMTNFYNEITLYCLFIFKYIHGNIKPETIFGSFILLAGGTMGLFFSTYCIYYINNLMEFTTEEQQAYTKLIKLLNPLNNEHKSANLVKIFIQMNKLYLDNQNIEDNYRKKKENELKALVQKTFLFRNRNFKFDPNNRSKSLAIIAENINYKEKKKFLKYLCTQFVLKIKFLTEIKNFKNNLMIARNNTLSLNDVLKTLGDKMNRNINQLNNKVEKLILNDKKFKNFMRFQEKNLKKVRIIMTYEDLLLQYLIERNNDDEISYYKDNKEMQNNFLNKYKGGGVKRLRSSYNGPFISLKKKSLNKNAILRTDIKNGKPKKENLKEIMDSHNAIKKEEIKLKKLKSLILGNNNNSMNNLNLNRSNTIPIKNLLFGKKKNENKNTKLNQKKFIKSKSIGIRIIKNKIFDSNYIPKINEKKRSLPNKNQIIDEFKNKI